MKVNTCVAILLALFVTVTQAKTKHAPMSPKVTSAKTVYVTNIGPSKLADKVYE